MLGHLNCHRLFGRWHNFHLPLIFFTGMYFACIMIMCSLSVVFTVLVLNYHHRSAETHEMPGWVKRGICEWLAWFMRMKRPGEPLSRKTLFKTDDAIRLQMKEQSSKSLLANVLDLEDDVLNGDAGIPIANGAAPKYNKELGLILKELRFITEKMAENEKNDSVTNDWHFAAMVIDRLCFYMFTFFTAVATGAILFSAPYIDWNSERKGGSSG